LKDNPYRSRSCRHLRTFAVWAGGDDGEAIRRNLKHLKPEIFSLTERGIDIRGGSALGEAWRTDKHHDPEIQHEWTASLPEIPALQSDSSEDEADLQDEEFVQHRNAAMRRFETLSTKQLKRRLCTKKLQVGGSKTELINRLVDYEYPLANHHTRASTGQGEPSNTSPGTCESTLRQGSGSGLITRCEAALPARIAVTAARSRWNKLKMDTRDGVPGLKAACRERGISFGIRVTKAHLIEKLLDFEFGERSATGNCDRVPDEGSAASGRGGNQDTAEDGDRHGVLDNPETDGACSSDRSAPSNDETPISVSRASTNAPSCSVLRENGSSASTNHSLALSNSCSVESCCASSPVHVSHSDTPLLVNGQCTSEGSAASVRRDNQDTAEDRDRYVVLGSDQEAAQDSTQDSVQQ
jgi:hypothetical protein